MHAPFPDLDNQDYTTQDCTTNSIFWSNYALKLEKEGHPKKAKKAELYSEIWLKRYRKLVKD